MDSKERLEKQVSEHIINSKKEIQIGGLNLIVYPTVFIPKGGSSLVFSRFSKSFNAKFEKVLDLGCGSGIISLLMSKYAKRIVAADINPIAVKTTKENAERNNISNINFLRSDLFENIKEKFDLIIFNPPFMGLKAKSDLEKAFTDENHEILVRFFKEAPKHLTKDGKIILEFADMGGEKLLKNLTKNYSKKLLYEEEIEDFAGVPTLYYILELKPN